MKQGDLYASHHDLSAHIVSPEPGCQCHVQAGKNAPVLGILLHN